MIKATFAALGRSVSPRQVAARRGKKVSDLLGPRRDQVPADASAAEAPNA
jgi:small subunit ribosomal protein S5